MHSPAPPRAPAATNDRARRHALAGMGAPELVPVVVAALIVLMAAGCAAAAAGTADPDSAGVIARAQRHVAILTGPGMHGRGYERDGHIKAASYIENQFRRMGLAPVDGNYRQPFRMRTTVFPRVPQLQVNGRALEPGTEFLPGEIGAGGETRRPLSVVTASEPDGEGVVVQDGRDPEALANALAAASARAAIVLVDVLYLSPRPQLVSKPVFYVHRSAWPSDARTVSYQVEPLRKSVQTQNVMARIEGSQPDSTLLLMAHYDHLGSLGSKYYFAGANDNASGVAMLLSLAEYYAHHQPKYSIVFVAFSGEEDGLRGSRYFRRNAPIDLDRVAFLLNFDMVASGEDGVTALGGSRFTSAYQLLDCVNRRLDLGGLSSRDVAPNSDHFPFMEAGIPGFFLYTKNGTQPYHHVHDVPETLEWHDFWHVYALSRQFIRAYMHRS